MFKDLSPFFSSAEFATPATLDGVAVLGIFDRPYAEASFGGFGAAASQPTYTLPTDQAVSPAGKVLVVSGIGTFLVAEVRPDGTGITVLILERA
jgi:hypothetical protein